jgi:DNA uptake protein ComE-like DNA-binding protein
LDTLPGIGPVLAQAIVDYRENVRPFLSVAEI